MELLGHGGPVLWLLFVFGIAIQGLLRWPLGFSFFTCDSGPQVELRTCSSHLTIDENCNGVRCMWRVERELLLVDVVAILNAVDY